MTAGRGAPPEKEERAPSTAIPRSVTVLSAALAAAGIAAAAEAPALAASHGEPAWAVLALLAALTMAARLQLRFSYREHYAAFDLFDAVMAPVVFVLPGPVAVVLAATAMGVSEALLRTRPAKLWFNVAQWVAAAGAGALVLAALRDGTGLSGRNLVALGAAMATIAAVNHVAIAAVLWLVTPGPVTRVAAAVGPVIRYGWLLNDTVNLAFGFLLVAAVDAGAWVTPLFVVPLGMLHWASRGYAEGRADRARLRGLQLATHALVGPLEPRDGIADFLSQVRSCFAVDVVDLVVAEGDRYRVQRLTTPDAVDVRSWTCPADADTLALALLRRGGSARVGSGHAHGALGDLLRSEGWRDCLAAPLLLNGEPRGILCAYDRSGLEGFETGEVAVLEALARELSGALEKAELVEEVLHQALHDALTGLPNRTLFHQRVQRAIAAAEPTGGRLAVMLIDVNRFKEVNDTLGHHNGDLLLQDFSRRIQECLRPGDTVARLGGDEFGIVVPRVLDEEGAQRVAQRVLDAIDAPFTLQDLTLDVDAAVGIALYPDHGDDPATLLQRADVAMYAAKASHEDMEVYTAANDRYSPRRLALVTELRSAASHGELRVVYQPKSDLRTGRVTGVEALLRWQHSRYGPVPPDEFIPIAEQTGSIRALTSYVLEEALGQCAAWRRSGLDLDIAVNLSARSLLDAKLPDEIDRLLRATAVPPRCVTLEITESSMMADPTRTAEILERLHLLGVQLSIDDFGTGYSSLSYLQRLPVDEMKIDKSFVIAMGSGNDDDVIVRSTVDLGHNLGLRVVAEGVELEEHWDRLVALGCDSAQGYWLSRPVPGEEIAPLLPRLGPVRSLAG